MRRLNYDEPNSRHRDCFSKDVCLTHMDGTENHSLAICFRRASNATRRRHAADTNQVCINLPAGTEASRKATNYFSHTIE